MASWAVQVHRPGSGSKWRGPRVSVPPPKGRSRSGPYPRPTTETHVVGITAVETPGETIVSRLGSLRILQNAHFFGRTGTASAGAKSKRRRYSLGLRRPRASTVTPAVIARGLARGLAGFPTRPSLGEQR
jgi:hypothetical protein